MLSTPTGPQAPDARPPLAATRVVAPLLAPAPASDRHGPALQPDQAALILALLLSLQPLTTDLLLAALPALAADLRAAVAPIQLTMAATVLGFGLAQLFWGPVADRFGRRPVMLCGLAAYAVATLGALLASSVEQLIVWRALQGAAMSAPVVCGRAMVRDLYEPHQGAAVMARALSRVGVVAVLCPTLSGLAVTAFGWRAAFVLMLLAGLGLAGVVALRLGETARQLNPHATRLRPLLRQVGQILRHPMFGSWTLLVSCSYGALFVCLAGAGVVLIQVLQVPALWAGVALSGMGLSYLAGTLCCRRWLPRHGLVGTVGRGAFFSLACALLMAAVAWADTRSVWALLLPMTLFSFGHGLHQPCGQTGAVAPFPHAAGLASALAGFALAVVATGVGLYLGQALGGDSVRPVAGGVAVGSGLTALVAWTVVRWHGEPPRESSGQATAVGAASATPAATGAAAAAATATTAATEAAT